MIWAVRAWRATKEEPEQLEAFNPCNVKVSFEAQTLSTPKSTTDRLHTCTPLTAGLMGLHWSSPCSVRDLTDSEIVSFGS